SSKRDWSSDVSLPISFILERTEYIVILFPHNSLAFFRASACVRPRTVCFIPSDVSTINFFSPHLISPYSFIHKKYYSHHYFSLDIMLHPFVLKISYIIDC